MNFRKMMAWILALIMVTGLLAACGNSEPASTPAAPAAQTQAAGQDAGQQENAAPAATEAPAAPAAEAPAAPAAEAPAADAPAADAPAADEAPDENEAAAPSDSLYNVDWEDMAEIRMVSMVTGPVPAGIQEVEDAINEITEAEINTHVKYEMVEVGSYIQQLSLIMSSGEEVDIVLTFPAAAAEVSNMRAAGQLMDITDLIDQYGQGLKDVCGEYFNATTFEGRIYAVPIMRDYVTSVHVIMRTDVLEDLGLMDQALQIKTMEDYEAILKAVKESEKWGYLAGIAPEMGNGRTMENSQQYFPVKEGEETVYFDVISTDLMGVDPTGKNPEIQILYDSAPFRERVALGMEWNEKGYIYKDSANDTTISSELIKSGKLFSCLKAGEYGVYASTTSECGMPMTVVKICTVPISTSSVTKFTWAIPNAAEYPEAAVTFLSLLYNDARLNNLLAYGIEGRDYVIEDGVAVFPNGDANVPYHGASFIVGNQFLALPWDGEPIDIREASWEQMQNAIVSEYLGFSFNTAGIETEVAAVTAVVQQYSTLLPSGLATLDTVDEFMTKLKAAQVDVVIQAAQEQLDAWIAANK